MACVEGVVRAVAPFRSSGGPALGEHPSLVLRAGELSPHSGQDRSLQLGHDVNEVGPQQHHDGGRAVALELVLDGQPRGREEPLPLEEDGGAAQLEERTALEPLEVPVLTPSVLAPCAEPVHVRYAAPAGHV